MAISGLCVQYHLSGQPDLYQNINMSSGPGKKLPITFTPVKKLSIEIRDVELSFGLISGQILSTANSLESQVFGIALL